VIPAVIGAALVVGLEFKRHTWATAILALLSGAFVAFIGTEPVVQFFDLQDNAAHAVAGVLGISGRNLIIWVVNASSDPLSFWRRKD
jgi:Na+/proline symporter